MSAPSKPWEGNPQNNNSPSFIAGNDIVSSNAGAYRYAVRPPAQIGLPPLPPRPSSQAIYPRISPYGMSPYAGYGMGGYGMGYPYGMRAPAFENRYVQLAEESAAPAFESIESFVRGFSAVTMMLESTYQAVHMSFRAVLSIAENMSRMRAAIFEFLSAITIFKTIYHFYRKVLHFLGLVNATDATWREAERQTRDAILDTASSTASRKSVWPMFAFLGAVVAGPALVYKYLLPNALPEDEEVTLIASHDFQAENNNELSFSKGDRLLTTKSQLRNGWILAKKGTSKGLIPSTRVKRLIRRNGEAVDKNAAAVPMSTASSSSQQEAVSSDSIPPRAISMPPSCPAAAGTENHKAKWHLQNQLWEEAMEKIMTIEEKRKKINDVLNSGVEKPDAQILDGQPVIEPQVQNTPATVEEPKEIDTPKNIETV